MSEYFEVTIGRDKIWQSPSCGSLIGLKDGRLMLSWVHESTVMANYSDDAGRTWTDPLPLKLENGENLTGVISPELVRLPSGALGMA